MEQNKEQLTLKSSSEIFTYTDPQYEKKVSFRPVFYERDVERIYHWMHQKHLIPFWRLNVSFDQFQEYLKKSIDADHKDLFIISVDDEPICYLIIYQVAKDNIRHYYPYQESDRGGHIAIGDKDYLKREYIFSILRGACSLVFNQYNTERIIVEPDSKNKIIIPTQEQCGFDTYGKVKLPHKRATLMILERQKFFEVLSNL